MAKVMSISLERDELNEKFGGGLPESSIVLIEGNDGGGKSILAQRLAYGLLENEETATYVSTELHTMGFVQQMSSIGYEVTQAILHEKLVFIPMFPYLGNVKLRDNFLERLMNTKKIFENKVIIIDTLSYLIVKNDVSKARMFEVMKFFKNVISLGKTVVFCIDPLHLNAEFLNIIRAMSDVYIAVEAKEVLGNLLRVASIKRFRRSEKTVAVQFPFKVEPKVGLSIELASLS